MTLTNGAGDTSIQDLPRAAFSAPVPSITDSEIASRARSVFKDAHFMAENTKDEYWRHVYDALHFVVRGEWP